MPSTGRRRRSRLLVALATVSFMVALLLQTPGCHAQSDITSTAGAGSVAITKNVQANAGDTADAQNEQSMADVQGRVIVAEASALLQQLDKTHPYLHHRHHAVVHRVLHPSLQMWKLPSMWGWDLQVPDWSGWSALEEETGASRKDLHSYVAQRDRAFVLLRRAWNDYRNVDAGYLLAEIQLFGNYSSSLDLHSSFSIFATLAKEYGNTTAQYYTGLFYATNIGNVLVDAPSSKQNVVHNKPSQHNQKSTVDNTGEKDTITNDKNENDHQLSSSNVMPTAAIHSQVYTDQARAQLYLEFAAMGGHIGAQMSLAYRYFTGIGCSRNCDRSVEFYYRVAFKVIQIYQSGPPGGRSLPPSRVRLSDEDGGVYGPGSSLKANTPGADSRGSPSEEDVLTYYKIRADEGDFEAQRYLGIVFYVGSSTIQRSYSRSMHYLSMAAGQYYGMPDSSPNPEVVNRADYRAMVGQVAGYIGRMYFRGEGLAIDNSTARKWFTRGDEHGDSISVTSLGIMMVEGTGDPNVVKQSPEERVKEANQGFERLIRASKSNSEAQAYLGMHYIGGGKHKQALEFLVNAARQGHLMAMFQVAKMNFRGEGTVKNCHMAVALLKAVVEKGIEWIDPLMVPAYNVLADGNAELSLLLYIMAAERGSEVAQSNVAWLIDSEQVESHPLLPVSRLYSFVNWNRAANQNNGDARVKTGDYYYYGLVGPVDYEKAVARYMSAADNEHSSIALWNLGYMHQHGIGVEKDFHLAKRYYDRALETNEDAWLPVKLSLFKLYITNLGEYLFGTEASGSIEHSDTGQDDEPIKGSRELPPSADKTNQQKQKDHKQVTDQQPTKKGDAQQVAQNSNKDRLSPPTTEKGSGGVDDDEEWEWRDLKRPVRRRGGSWISRLFGDSNDVKTKGNGQKKPQQQQEEDDDEDLENFIILLLCLFVAYLVYVRQLRFGANLIPLAAAQQQRAPPPPPPPVDR